MLLAHLFLIILSYLLLLLRRRRRRRFSRVRLCATPYTAAYQAPPSLGFSRQEYWSGLPFPSPMHESEKWKWSLSVVSNSSRPHGLQPTSLLHPWDFLGKSTGVGCHCLLRIYCYKFNNNSIFYENNFLSYWYFLQLQSSGSVLIFFLVLLSSQNLNALFIFLKK